MCFEGAVAIATAMPASGMSACNWLQFGVVTQATIWQETTACP